MQVTAEVRHVVTAFLRDQGQILLVRRSDMVGSYRGRWSAISGYLEDPTPLAQAFREIQEETALPEAEVHLVREGVPLEILDSDMGVCWVVHPFLFDIDDRQRVTLDWENMELCWVDPKEIVNYLTVPQLTETWEAVDG